MDVGMADGRDMDVGSAAALAGECLSLAVASIAASFCWIGISSIPHLFPCGIATQTGGWRKGPTRHADFRRDRRQPGPSCHVAAEFRGCRVARVAREFAGFSARLRSALLGACPLGI